MAAQGIDPVYVQLDPNLQIKHSLIKPQELLGDDYTNLFFAFESDFPPYRPLVVGNLPRVDLVTQRNGQSLSALEVKLTALPDETTFHLAKKNMAVSW